jgi:hypothetical protein
MPNIIAMAAAACLLVAASAAPAVAQYHYGPRAYVVVPHGGYGYAYPRYGDYPAGYDSGGAPFSYRDLGWQPGPPGTAPANPCTFSLRQQNRC